MEAIVTRFAQLGRRHTSIYQAGGTGQQGEGAIRIAHLLVYNLCALGRRVLFTPVSLQASSLNEELNLKACCDICILLLND